MSGPILPGARLGVLGSGQLGRMFAIAARRMGYRVQVFSPDRDTPTGQVADVEVVAPYDDLDAVAAFARRVDALTFEFENVPAATAAAAADHTRVRPAGHVLHVTQQRAREKSFVAALGVPVTPFALVDDEAALGPALERIGCPAVLKSARFGYDGKGQATIASPEAARECLSRTRQPAVRPRGSSSTSASNCPSSPRGARTEALRTTAWWRTGTPATFST